MRTQHIEAQHLARPIDEQVANGDEVTFALRHFPALDLQEAIVHPDARHQRSRESAAALSELILMVRENEIDAARMDIKGFAEKFPAHGRTFDMPAGPPPAPRAFPAGKIGRRWFPQDEIHWALFVGS